VTDAERRVCDAAFAWAKADAAHVVADSIAEQRGAPPSVAHQRAAAAAWRALVNASYVLHRERSKGGA
jgi:hypothetical protein